MALKTFVKISEVNNLSDARYAAGMAVDLMGFSLLPNSPSFVSPESFMELTGWVSGVQFVGEFGMASPESIEKTLSEYEIDYIQTDNPEVLALPSSHKKILRFDMDKLIKADEVKALMATHAADVEFFLFESGNGITYKESVQKEVLALAKKYPMIVGFNIDRASVETLINQHPVKGIALKGGEEIRPGFKDFDELADILEALEIDDTL